MKKVELMQKWQEETEKYYLKSLSLRQLEAAYNGLMDVITNALAAGEEITLPGVGKLKTRETSARDGRNPRTGEKIAVPAKHKAVFTVSSVLKDKLNG